MSKNEAMSEYVRLVTEINQDWQQQQDGDLGGKKKENWICNSTLGQDNDLYSYYFLNYTSIIIANDYR